MGILDFLFKSISKEEPVEIVRYRLSVAALVSEPHVHIVTADGTRFHADEFFKASKKLLFSRFYILHEEQYRPQFAPSLEEAIRWFTGKEYPQDGYTATSWGRDINQQCVLCESIIRIPIRIKTIECLTIYMEIPDYKEIVGWRVSEVESKLLGKGVPTKIYTIDRDHPVIKWDSPKEKVLCQRCVQPLKDTSSKP